jgi:hypothetical protein
MYYIVGCGGGGTYLLSVLSKTVSVKNICLVDGDKVEKKNLSRQIIFDEDDVGDFKSVALAKKIGCKYEARYISENDPLKMEKGSVMFICVDNQPARKNCLEIVDKSSGVAIVCGNEYDSAQSYIYRARWKDSENDPRIKFPEILSDTSRDPLNPHCSDEYESEPQLAIFNALSATMGMHLFYLWTEKKDVLDTLKSKMFCCNFNKYTQK